MSPLQMKSVQGGPRNLYLKLAQNLAINSWDIADIEFLVVLLRVLGQVGGWPGGRMGGVSEFGNKAISASIEVEVELSWSEAELCNRFVMSEMETK